MVTYKKTLSLRMNQESTEIVNNYLKNSETNTINKAINEIIVKHNKIYVIVEGVGEIIEFIENEMFSDLNRGEILKKVYKKLQDLNKEGKNLL